MRKNCFHKETTLPLLLSLSSCLSFFPIVTIPVVRSRRGRAAGLALSLVVGRPLYSFHARKETKTLKGCSDASPAGPPSDFGREREESDKDPTTEGDMGKLNEGSGERERERQPTQLPKSSDRPSINQGRLFFLVMVYLTFGLQLTPLRTPHSVPKPPPCFMTQPPATTTHYFPGFYFPSLTPPRDSSEPIGSFKLGRHTILNWAPWDRTARQLDHGWGPLLHASGKSEPAKSHSRLSSRSVFPHRMVVWTRLPASETGVSTEKNLEAVGESKGWKLSVPNDGDPSGRPPRKPPDGKNDTNVKKKQPSPAKSPTAPRPSMPAAFVGVSRQAQILPGPRFARQCAITLTSIHTYLATINLPRQLGTYSCVGSRKKIRVGASSLAALRLYSVALILGVQGRVTVTYPNGTACGNHHKRFTNLEAASYLALGNPGMEGNETPLEESGARDNTYHLTAPQSFLLRMQKSPIATSLLLASSLTVSPARRQTVLSRRAAAGVSMTVTNLEPQLFRRPHDDQNMNKSFASKGQVPRSPARSTAVSTPSPQTVGARTSQAPMLGDHHEISSSPLGPEARSLTQGLASSTIHDSTSTRRKVKKLRNVSKLIRQSLAASGPIPFGRIHFSPADAYLTSSFYCVKRVLLTIPYLLHLPLTLHFVRTNDPFHESSFPASEPERYQRHLPLPLIKSLHQCSPLELRFPDSSYPRTVNECSRLNGRLKHSSISPRLICFKQTRLSSLFMSSIGMMDTHSSSETRQMQARPLIQRTLHAVIALATAAAAAAAAAAVPSHLIPHSRQVTWRPEGIQEFKDKSQETLPPSCSRTKWANRSSRGLGKQRFKPRHSHQMPAVAVLVAVGRCNLFKLFLRVLLLMLLLHDAPYLTLRIPWLDYPYYPALTDHPEQIWYLFSTHL
ncbi:uncharacterized protein CLUP02_11847 [Colletotrichum lupini]|uniref:Uncharacterized protein n=1 Tax=Colletotrichum lupini TaxID=145971 RepID=A0A9Q8WKP1_9PEZI|nr:uncharacterized protein CLUP02_11847 [Colletotrichum lupini]UQC86347.1 hypothetical protein CLUP02_11847 [Colletotrichum lupini]